MDSARYQISIFRKGPPLHLIILVFALWNQILYTQPHEWNIKYFSTEDGLSSNHVNCVTGDSRGFIWVGTDNGLNRFDGYTFSTLRLPSGASHPLSRLKALTVFEDKEGILWIGTTDGLFRYDPREPVTAIKQYRYLNKPEIYSYRIFQPVSEICEDKNGLFWLVCNDPDEGITREIRTFDRNKETFECIYPDSSFIVKEGDEVMHSFTTGIYSDRKGDLWFGTNVGLFRYVFEDGSFEKFTPSPDSLKSYIDWTLKVYEDRFGNFWTSNIYGLSLFDRNNLNFGNHIPLDSKNWWQTGFHSLVYKFGEDRNGYLWMRVNESLVRIMTGPEGFLDHETMKIWETDYSTMEINPLFSFFVQSPWLIWMGVSDRGLCRVNAKRNDFKVIEPVSLFYTGIIDLDYIQSLFIDLNDNVWISNFHDDPVQYDMKTKKVFKHTGFPNANIHGIETDQNGNLWFASRYGKVARSTVYRTGKTRLTLYIHDNKDPSSITPRNELHAEMKGSVSPHLWEHLLFRDESGTLWFNSGRGIHDRYDPASDGFIHLDHRIPDFINNDTCVEKEVAGEIWFPSSEGLLRLLPPFTESAPFTIAPKATILYRNTPDDETSLSSDWVKAICFSRHHEPGTLWIGTIGGGLNRLMYELVEGSELYQIRFRHYTTADGLCDNNILGIIEDSRGYLWLSTLNGLSRFDPGAEVFHNFYREDGLPSNTFSWADPRMNSAGELFFPTEYGVVHFHPDSIRINEEIPRVFITGLEIFNEPVYPGENSPLTRDITVTKSIELSYRQNFLSFEFAALNFEQTERNRYRYMLEGLESDWANAGIRRYAEYKGLKPGSYTFRVLGSNNSGVWNEEGASIDILIHNPPWKTWWAYLIYFTLLAGAVMRYRQFLLNRERLKAMIQIERLEKEKVKEIDAFRLRFFTNISHEFRTPLTLVEGPLEDSLKVREEPVPMKKNLLRAMLRNTRRLKHLINQLLDISKIESGNMHLQLIRGNLPAFVRTIASSFLSLAESINISYKISVHEVKSELCFDPDKLEKIINNLLSNAFKFTPGGGEVSLELTCCTPEMPQSALLKVSDTGKGIDKEHLGHIFDRFYQVSDSDTREAEGSGIGLAITSELLELMHGEIEVESLSGKGTTFVVTFPVSEECFSEQEVADMESRKSVSDELGEVEAEFECKIDGEREKEELSDLGFDGGIHIEDNRELILVVEDNDDLRMYISEQFLRAYRVVEATNGQTGMEKAIERIPDLVVADIMMPVMDGMDMCRRLKAHPATNHIPVIMLTAKADKRSKLTGLEAAADDYIVKPFDSELLLARASNLINQRKELRRHFEKNFLMEGDPKTSASPAFLIIRDVLKAFEKHLSEPDFNIYSLGKELKMSRSQVYRKIHSVTGNTPKSLLRLIRMKHAARLLRSGTMNITQVMYKVGMQSPSHFASSFRKYFGVNPKDYGKSR